MGTEGRKTDKLHKSWRDRLRNNRCYENNNNGYSIIELIIVLAIIAIIISTVFYSIILVFSANAKSCANNMQRSIGDCKVTTMGKSAAYMELYRDADQNVYTRMYVMDSGGSYVPSEPQKVGTSRVYVAYTPEGGAETELLAGDKIEIRFDRASGGFEEDASGNIYEKLHVQGGSKKYEIVLTKLTGKSEVNLVP
ncbi:MAG: prepilin-type N-terminal cleavage/methylation domain-containing protein [Lachnospiraceae bacterium]|nr:prepilin-type N-terminal cleavage/methylation domain-containing protein [Lachnospiraceae bacterium]